MEDAPAPAAGPAAGPQQQQQQSSPLLRCLSQLNDDVLATYLLPKLVEQGSAGAVVLTCSQLRALCQPSIQHLDLSKQQLQDADNPCRSSELAKQLVATFPQCTSLAFAYTSSSSSSADSSSSSADSSSSVARVYRGISTLLRGLPHLSTVTITHGYSPDEDLHLVMCQLCTHAATLRSLHLQLSSCLGDDETWASLGKLSTLTRLQLSFDKEVPDPCTQLSLRHLTGLSKLQCLRIEAEGVDELDYTDVYYDEDAALQLAVEQFPGRLTALTELQLPLGLAHNIHSISACVNMRDLRLIGATDAAPGLHHKEWAALAQLTRLTCLIVEVGLDDPHHAEPFYGVLGQLKGLRDVGVNCWTRSALPVLQGLTSVTAVHGGWVRYGGDEDFTGLACPHIRELRAVYRCLPWQAFPGLLAVSCYWMCAESFKALGRHCTGLQRLALIDTHELSIGDMWNHRDEDQHGTMRSLACLKHLTSLGLAPGNDAELIAFTSAVAAGGGAPQLRCLHVRGPLSLFALMQLLSVRGLQELSVRLTHSHASFSNEGVRVWLVGLAVVPKVSLVLWSEEQLGVVEAAREWVVQSELPLPAVLKVSVI